MFFIYFGSKPAHFWEGLTQVEVWQGGSATGVAGRLRPGWGPASAPLWAPENVTQQLCWKDSCRGAVEMCPRRDRVSLLRVIWRLWLRTLLSWVGSPSSYPLGELHKLGESHKTIIFGVPVGNTKEALACLSVMGPRMWRESSWMVLCLVEASQRWV